MDHQWKRWVYGVVVSVICMALAATGVLAAPVLWAVPEGGNGHWYELVLVESMTWSAAYDQASARTFMGVDGHLATLTSSAENEFVYGTFGFDFYYSVWLGGWQDPGLSPEQGWHWVTGEPWSYTNWAPGEPNDATGDERYLELRAYDGKWNDDEEYTDPARTEGYLVEYPVPEPATVSLLAMGLSAVLVQRRRAKKIRPP